MAPRTRLNSLHRVVERMMSVCWDTIQKVAPSQCTPDGHRRGHFIRPGSISDNITLFSHLKARVVRVVRVVRGELPTTPRTHCLKTRAKSMRTANLDPSMLTCQHRHEKSDRNTAGRPSAVNQHRTNTRLITGPPSTADGTGWRLGSSGGALGG